MVKWTVLSFGSSLPEAQAGCEMAERQAEGAVGQARAFLAPEESKAHGLPPACGAC